MRNPYEKFQKRRVDKTGQQTATYVVIFLNILQKPTRVSRNPYVISAKPQSSEEHSLRNTVIDDLRMNFEICLKTRNVVERAIFYYSTMF